MKSSQLRNVVLGIAFLCLAWSVFVLFNRPKAQPAKRLIKDGIHKTYYQGGRVREEVMIKGGRPTGVRKMYDAEGTLKQINTYTNGKMTGPCKTYFKDGKVAGEFILKEGMVDGPYKFYYESGNLREEGVYKNGKTIKSTVYAENGSVIVWPPVQAKDNKVK